MVSTRITFDLLESSHVRSLLIDHAAELLGVSRRTVYYRIREGRLRTIRTRCGSQRVLVDSAEEMLRDEMRPPAARVLSDPRLPTLTRAATQSSRAERQATQRR